MNIYLVRHAEVEEKYLGCYNGWIDISISEKGHGQACELSERLKGIGFDKVYSSDLKRCKESLEYFGFESVFYENSLREKQWGENEGFSYDQVCKNNSTEYRDFNQWIEVLGGESMESFNARIKDVFFNKILLDKVDNILVMTHAGVIRTILSGLGKKSVEESFKFNIPYASCTQIEKRGNKLDIVKVGIR